MEQLPISEMYCVKFGDEKTTDKRVASLIDGEPERVESFSEILQKYSQCQELI